MTVNLALNVTPKLLLKNIPKLVSTKSHEIEEVQNHGHKKKRIGNYFEKEYQAGSKIIWKILLKSM